jgi:hypothetical protein
VDYPLTGIGIQPYLGGLSPNGDRNLPLLIS